MSASSWLLFSDQHKNMFMNNPSAAAASLEDTIRS
jgi:hypothetical protein